MQQGIKNLEVFQGINYCYGKQFLRQKNEIRNILIYSELLLKMQQTIPGADSPFLKQVLEEKELNMFMRWIYQYVFHIGKHLSLIGLRRRGRDINLFCCLINPVIRFARFGKFDVTFFFQLSFLLHISS